MVQHRPSSSSSSSLDIVPSTFLTQTEDKQNALLAAALAAKSPMLDLFMVSSSKPTPAAKAMMSVLMHLSLKHALAVEQKYMLSVTGRVFDSGKAYPRGLLPLPPAPSPAGSATPTELSPNKLCGNRKALKQLLPEAPNTPVRLNELQHSVDSDISISEHDNLCSANLPAGPPAIEPLQQLPIPEQGDAGMVQDDPAMQNVVQQRFAPDCIRMGLYTAMGQRSTMEDFAFAVPLRQPDAPECWFSHGACFGVFDGHGGHEVAQSLAEHVPSQIQQAVHHIATSGPEHVGEILLGHERRLRTDSYNWAQGFNNGMTGSGRMCHSETLSSTNSPRISEPTGSLRRAPYSSHTLGTVGELGRLNALDATRTSCVIEHNDCEMPAQANMLWPSQLEASCDGELEQLQPGEITLEPIDQDEWDEVMQGRDPGSTALVTTIIDDRMYVANVGDCRLLLAELDPETNKVQVRTVTIDHVPKLHKGEAERLAKLQIPVSNDGYVGHGGGYLQVSRSIGDFSTKTKLGESVILSEPELHSVQLSANTLFAVAASDGITCAMSDDTIVNQVCKYLNEDGPKGLGNCPQHAAEQLVKYAIDAANSADNAAVVVTCFTQKKPPLPQRPRLFGGARLALRKEPANPPQPSAVAPAPLPSKVADAPPPSPPVPPPPAPPPPAQVSPLPAPAPTAQVSPLPAPTPTAQVSPLPAPAPTAQVSPLPAPAPTAQVSPLAAPQPTAQVPPLPAPAPMTQVSPLAAPPPAVQASPLAAPPPTTQASPSSGPVSPPPLPLPTPPPPPVPPPPSPSPALLPVPSATAAPPVASPPSLAVGFATTAKSRLVMARKWLAKRLGLNARSKAAGYSL